MKLFAVFCCIFGKKKKVFLTVKNGRKMKKATVTLMLSFLTVLALSAQTVGNDGLEFKTWAATPPMGWNSWDCFGPTVVESEVKANADYMADHLLKYGWEYVVVDIRWFVENDKAGGYNQTNPIYDMDEYGRYIPAPNRFPSSANGAGFKPLADYVHAKGLKFGIHLMRGLPKLAVTRKCPVKGTDGITCDQIFSTDSACTWLRDNYKVDYRKKGAQEYYNSCFDMYAEWGVDFVKIDDLSRPYHTAEIEMIRHAIDQTGRPIVLSISPGETPLEKVEHVKRHANMWRTVDDFWDNWSQLNYQFQVCAKWAPHIAEGTWPDADMLPLGHISIRGERGADRQCQFTEDEQYTMMNLWTIFKSPLMFGGNLPDNTPEVNALLTNTDVLRMHHYSQNNRQVSSDNGRIVWAADDPETGDKYAALFNTTGTGFVNTEDALWRSGTISYLTTGHRTDVDVVMPEGSSTLCLVATDGGDGYDSDHADWVNPVVTFADGSEKSLTLCPRSRATQGWGTLGVNKSVGGGSLRINGTTYSQGFGTHANSCITFEFDQPITRFRAIAGLDNSGTDQGSKSSVEFMVFNYDATYREEPTDANAGGKVLKVDPRKQVAVSRYISSPAGVQTDEIEADIAGTEKLFLVVTNGGDGFSYDHADWATPTLVDADGNEVALTDVLNWDANPINGWNPLPQKGKNNDGNAMRLQGKTYNKGIGCNAPSMIVYTLPADHRYVKFRSLVGHDDDVKGRSDGATMEFRVFTEDPTPVNDAAVTLDLTALGYAADEEVTVTDMWTGAVLGTYKGSSFAPVFRSHASGLYRLGTGADNISTVRDSQAMKVSPSGNGIVITTTVPVRVPVYTLGGTLVKMVRAHRGNNPVTLSRGVYVVGGQTLVVE